MEADLEKILAEHGYNIHLKHEQTECLLHLNEGSNVFAQLPTGFGKSMVYTLFPLLKEKTLGKPQTALVVSPLKSLMKDQIQLLRSHGVRCEAIVSKMTQESMTNIWSGDISVLFTSPEALEVMMDDKIFNKLKEQFCLLAFDEAHCISQWGLEFRPMYRKVAEVVSVINNIPTLALTATATRDIYQDIRSVLALSDENTHLVARIPDRPNIFLHIESAAQQASKSLHWIIRHIVDKGSESKKILIYTVNMRQCETMFMWLMSELKQSAYAGKVSRGTRLIEMVHSKTDQDSLDRVLAGFPEGQIRLVVATVAFGMGIQVDDIDIVVHWGVEGLLVYWQEVGRCARDGHQGYALTYAYPRSVVDCADNVLKTVLKDKKCLRKDILAHFRLPGVNYSEEMQQCDFKCVTCSCSKCMCCTFCADTCRCPGRISGDVTDRLLTSS